MPGTVNDRLHLRSTNLLDLIVNLLWCFAIVEFRSDRAWITCTMKKPKYNNLVIFYHKINGVFSILA